MASSAPMRFRPPLWLGILLALMTVVQATEVFGRWPVAAALLTALGAFAVIYHFMAAGTVFSEKGITTSGRWWRTHYRWDEVTFLGPGGRGGSCLTVTLADGKHRRLAYVPVDEYPAIRKRFPVPLPGQERAATMEDFPAR